MAWMFRFLRPVTRYVVLACFYLVLGVGAEILTVRQTGRAANFIQTLHPAEGSAPRFHHWVSNGAAEPLDWRHIVGGVIGGPAGFSALIAGLVLITAALLRCAICVPSPRRR